MIGAYSALQSSFVQTKITRALANSLSKRLNANISIEKVDAALFNRLKIRGILIEDQGGDTLLFTQEVSVKVDDLSFRHKQLFIQELEFENNQINLARDSAASYNFRFLIDSLQGDSSAKDRWELDCNQFGFRNSSFSLQDKKSGAEKNIFLYDLNVNVSQFRSKEDSITFLLNSVNLNNGKSIYLEDLSAEVQIYPERIDVSGIKLLTKRSELKESQLSVLLNQDTIGHMVQPKFDLRVEGAKISMLELAEFIPSLRGMRQELFLKGRIYGDLDDLKGKEISLHTGQSTRTVFDFYINGLKDPETMYLFFDLTEARTSFSDLSRIRLPNKSKVRYLEFPEALKKSGLLKYTGNFSGFLSDFVSFGKLESDMGIIHTDLSVIPNEEQKTTRYRGRLSTENFEIGNFLQREELGKISFEGEVDGQYDINQKNISGFFKGDVGELDFNGYTYQNISLDGLYLDQMYDGQLSVRDPNLKFDFQGQVDLNEDIPEFNFNLNMYEFQMGKLNLSDDFPSADMAFNMKAKFNGNHPDNLRGVILMQNGSYENKNGKLDLTNLQLVSVPGDSLHRIDVSSDFVDAKLIGKFNFRNLLSSFRQSIRHYMPALYDEEVNEGKINRFEYEVNVKNLDPVLEVFYPNLKIETPFIVYGDYDANAGDLEINASIPGVEYKDLWFRNIFFGNKSLEGQYVSKMAVGEVLHRKGRRLYDLTIQSNAGNNEFENTIEWNNSRENILRSRLSSTTIISQADSTDSPSVEIQYDRSEVYLGDSLWVFEPFVTRIDSGRINIQDFDLHRSDQSVKVNGWVAKNDYDRLKVNINDIDLSFMQANFGERDNLDGKLNGTILLASLYSKPVLIVDARIDSLHFENQLFGSLDLSSMWNVAESKVDTRLELVKNNKKNLVLNGYYAPETREVSFKAQADSLPLNLLGTVIKRNLSDFYGHGTGELLIDGSVNDLRLNGGIYTDSAAVTIDYTQTRYMLDDTVYFKDNQIVFDKLVIKDKLGNQGFFDGALTHTNFKKMAYDLSLSSPRILAFNTTARDNAQFYGDVIANCKMGIIGKEKVVVLSGTATTLKGTDVKISMEAGRDVQQYNFFKFRLDEENEQERQFFAQKPKGDFSLELTVEATPESQVQLIYNENIGDVIQAQGEGLMFVKIDKDFNIELSGNYNVTQGQYLFTLQNVLSKRFTIEPGGSIIWSGDPYNAIIDITAIYKLRAALYDLMLENTLIGQTDITQRIPVECKIMLTEELTNPNIDFDIAFPEEDEALVGILQQYINTEEEMNKQIISLIVLGKFYTPEYLRGGDYSQQDPNALGTTASEVFSNQLSNWLSQISNDVDVGFNYRPGNSITDDEIELALSTQIFNDRVTLNGNIGNNVNPETKNSNQIVGDFEMRVKLVQSGKIQFKAFNRSNNNLIYETAPYTQGIGFSFKEEYNTVEELARKITNIFRKRENRKSF